jgi:hypothetical protein
VADSVFSLSIVDPNTDQNALMLEFQNVALPDGSEATATFVHGQTDLYLSLSDETNFAALITPLQAPPIQVYLPAINK